jgi:hypothetical protein
VVVLASAFISLIFVSYDYFVNRRQHKFLERVIKKEKIMVNDLPAAIRDIISARMITARPREQLPMKPWQINR